jgi:CheY-like chemotaxis protein
LEEIMTAPLPSAPLPHPVRNLALARAPLRILVWDDDLEFAEELASGLNLCRYDVRTLMGVPSPVALFESFAPQIVLLDIHMPAPDGFEVVDLLRHGLKERDVSLILMSGSGMTLPDMAASLCAAGQIKVAGVLQKPLRIADITRLCDLAMAD